MVDASRMGMADGLGGASRAGVRSVFGNERGTFVQYPPLYQHDLVTLKVVLEDEVYCTYPEWHSARAPKKRKY
jgi:hypothetical protein